jgi:hypothetical protein
VRVSEPCEPWTSFDEWREYYLSTLHRNVERAESPGAIMARGGVSSIHDELAPRLATLRCLNSPAGTPETSWVHYGVEPGSAQAVEREARLRPLAEEALDTLSHIPPQRSRPSAVLAITFAAAGGSPSICLGPVGAPEDGLVAPDVLIAAARAHLAAS